MSQRPLLHALAERVGILPGHHSALDGRYVETRDGTRVALLAALGFDASTEATAEEELTRLEAQAADAGGMAEAPASRCVSAWERLGPSGGFGFCVNLYSLRSSRNLGFGNLADLSLLVRLAGAEGAAFVGVNPLHALPPGGVCPYLPSSRLFRHPLYLDPTAIPELVHTPEAGRRLEGEAFREERERLRSSEQLDVVAVGALLETILSPLHASFRRGVCGSERTRAFERYRHEQGPALANHALFEALGDFFERGGMGRDWRRWPAPFRSPGSSEARKFGEEHAAEVERHAWIQFELDRQLGEVADEARRAGLSLGLYTDLALGSDPAGSDAWSFPESFVSGVRVGAPPDAFSPEGQEWGFPPLDPGALPQDGYAFFTHLLRAGFRHAGALRIDHAMCLERLFWIPEGRPPSEGAYVRYPRDALLGVLVRESLRHGAAVIAEDLGTVPEGFGHALAERGILSSRVALFERDDLGFRPSGEYPRETLVTANTHDLPPLAALAGDSDLRLRHSVGHLPDDAALEAAQVERARDREQLDDRLRSEGFLREGEVRPTDRAAALTAFLCATPACLVGVSLDDLALEIEPVNLPGVPPERHPSWRRRVRRPLETLLDAEPARACLAAIPASRRAPR